MAGVQAQLQALSEEYQKLQTGTPIYLKNIRRNLTRPS